MKKFNIGDKIVIKNINEKFHVSDEARQEFIDKEVEIMAKFEIPYATPESSLKMVAVMNEFGQCMCFREEMCYPIKSKKEKAIEHMLYIITQGGTVYDIAERFYIAGYRKTKG